MEVKRRSAHTWAGVLILVMLVWAGGYLAFRSARMEVWPRDGRSYVIYPDTTAGRTAYYAWRPLAWLDDRFAGVGAHLGPHLEPLGPSI